jgi:hypothetical protein
MTQKSTIPNNKTAQKWTSLSSSMAGTINSNVKQESKEFQKEEINSFNTSTYGKLQTNVTNTEILPMQLVIDFYFPSICV